MRIMGGGGYDIVPSVPIVYIVYPNGCSQKLPNSPALSGRDSWDTHSRGLSLVRANFLMLK
jgi:hypothetical protein